MFLTKTSCFVTVIIRLIDETIDRFRLFKSIDRPVSTDFQVFITDEQTINWFTWYEQAVDQFNLFNLSRVMNHFFIT
jgi:hypothetical protein